MPAKLRALQDAHADATTAESRAAALQYVRLATGMVRPHPDDAQRFEALVLEIARATQDLIDMKDDRQRAAAPAPVCRAV